MGHFRGSKWVPNRLRRGFKNDVENDAPKMAQIGPQEPPKAPQVGPQIGPKSVPDPHIFFRDPLRNRLGPPGCSGPPPGPRRDPSGTPPGPLRDPPGPPRDPPGTSLGTPPTDLPRNLAARSVRMPRPVSNGRFRVGGCPEGHRIFFAGNFLCWGPKGYFFLTFSCAGR